jgi:photosystem II stability/assembly factor-like uncharacterized protein
MAHASKPSYVYAGAAHWTSAGDTKNPGGLFRMTIGNGGWQELKNGLPAGTEIRVIAVHPQDAQIIYAGTNQGPYRSTDGGDHWERLGFPDPGMVVWSMVFHPTHPQTMYLGTAPAFVYRSDNGGDTWRRLPNAKQPERVPMGFDTRLIRLAVDPSKPDEVYAGVEVGGVMRSLDGGETWTDCSQHIIKLAEQSHLKSKIGSDTEIEGMMDTHALCVSSAQPGTVFLAVRMGLFRSADRGMTWEDMQVGRFSPLTYARDVQVSPQDPRVMYACLSPAARSRDGSLYRSQDLGQTWQRFDHDLTPRSTMMSVALHGQDSQQVYCNTRGGQVFGTQDGGVTWHEYPLPANIQDVYAVACA